MNKQFCIGNITRVRWHYVNMKYGYMAWGHMSGSFDKNYYISNQNPHLETATIITQDRSMNPDKYYAYVCVDKDNKLIIRNIFDSKHEKEFDQKNAYFQDKFLYDLFLDDTSNLLDEYLKLGECSRVDNDLLYFCVEYEPNNTLDIDLLIHCSNIINEKSALENRVNILEGELKSIKEKKSFFSRFW